MTKYKVQSTKYKGLLFLIGFVVFLSTMYSVLSTSFAQECGSDLDCQIAAIQREISALSPAQEKNKADLAVLNKQVADLTSKINKLTSQLKTLETSIATREKDLAFTKTLFDAKAKDQYTFLRLYDPITPFLFSDSASNAFREINFRQKAAESDRELVDGYAVELIKLKSDKDSLEKNKASLSSLQSQVSEKQKFLAGEVAKVDSYLSTLTAKQNELAAAKSGGFETSVGDTPPSLEPCTGPKGSPNFCDPGFSPAFAAFSFGAPHRTGLSQYGAYGRSKSGQSAEQILSAYYGGATLDKSYSSSSTIGVKGYGRVSLEDNYLLGIYEIPESWGDNGGFEALKAQAVVARSYALYSTNNGAGTICTTEACQVYKPQLKSGKWKEAVQATRGWVMLKNGSPAPTYFSASTGGYTISQWGWNGIKDASGNWPDTAYEKVAGSPWFYKGWYKSRGGSSCGRNNPWLNSTEMADILNAWKVLYQGGGDTNRISPVGSCWGGNPYSMSDLSNLGGFTSVSGVSQVIYGNDGSTTSVKFSTNKGDITIPGTEFKKAFNLRAPGYVGLKSSLFNIEKL
ncbi:MAG TPA: SpoIID/LytB domain-containing protein [Alphaproteobacteria bacterium]|jgi:peptidoglycan hydrolase CwlO-like protein|nr:SpoIID/LytB domain-containing protein [Alphaproteobacteria bacterium]